MLGLSPVPLVTPTADRRPPRRVLTGTVLDASPHLLVLRTPAGERRVAMSGTTSVWHGGRADLAALRPGRSAIARLAADGLAADRVWVEAARVTGTILARGRDALEIDMGPHRGRAHVDLPPAALGQVLVRHPKLEPGYLADVICVRTPDGPRAVRPGTSQPGHRAAHPPGPARGAAIADPVHGTATWFGDAVATPGLGAAYPAVDAEGDAGGCADAPDGCAALPLLSLGSEIRVLNQCTGHLGAVPVTECGCVAARYCDRCVECGTSPRGRVAELTPAAFVGLGGELETGCFNAFLFHGAGGGQEARPW
ncbi:hypothetical protein [Actinomadura macrotermitis]|uniref:hypothetical protein n=1 Tax=Actinomadura macrotermitis TaxID=2585200 RepID=UPI002E26B967